MKNISMYMSKIPGRSVMYLVLCVVILVIFYFVALYPYQRSLGAIEAKTVQVKALIEKQKVLRSLYEEMVKRGENKFLEKLPVPDTKALSRRDIDIPSQLFKEIADESGLHVISVRPDVLTLTEESDDMMVALHLRGRFLDFRKFLVGVGGVPSLKRVEAIEIKQENGREEIYLTVRLAIG